MGAISLGPEGIDRAERNIYQLFLQAIIAKTLQKNAKHGMTHFTNETTKSQ